MSILTPLGINNLLGSHSNNILKQTLTLTPPPKIIRKHYDGHDGHDNQDHHEEHHYTKKKSRSIALTALTLLAFLFFLHILQQCLHDQVEMTSTTTASTIILKANIQAKDDAQQLDKEELADFGKIPRDSEGDKVEVTTAFSYMEKFVPVETSKEESNLYQYDKIHVPVKMKMVEHRSNIKKL